MKGGVIDNTPDDAAAFGIDLGEPVEPEHFEVEPEAWDAVQMFLRCQTQWRAGPSGLIGLDYLALDLGFRLYGAEDPPAMLEAIQVIEGEVLTLIHDRKN